MRSTPWPNDTFRTVNDARVPPRCRPITTPSKIWMRSLSPSRTFTWTRTVSPAFIAGRSVNWAFSTSSIALMSQLLQDLFFFFVQVRTRQQVRPPIERPAQRLALPPTADFAVIPRQQYLRHLHHSLGRRRVPERNFGRPSVLRKIPQPTVGRVRGHRLLVADDARHEPGDGVEDYQRRQFPAGQHVIPNRQFFRDSLPDPFGGPFVPAAHHDNVFVAAQPLRGLVRERPALRRRHDHRQRLSSLRLDRVKRPENRFRLQDHSRSPTVRHVVHDAMTVGPELTQSPERQR